MVLGFVVIAALRALIPEQREHAQPADPKSADSGRELFRQNVSDRFHSQNPFLGSLPAPTMFFRSAELLQIRLFGSPIGLKGKRRAAARLSYGSR